MIFKTIKTSHCQLSLAITMHRGVVIYRSDYKETFSSVDNVQLLSSINPHDGTVINDTIL